LRDDHEIIVRVSDTAAGSANRSAKRCCGRFYRSNKIRKTRRAWASPQSGSRIVKCTLQAGIIRGGGRLEIICPDSPRLSEHLLDPSMRRQIAEPGIRRPAALREASSSRSVSP